MRNPADKITAIKAAVDLVVAETWTTANVILDEWNLTTINPTLPYGIINAGTVDFVGQPAVNLQTAKVNIDFAYVATYANDIDALSDSNTQVAAILGAFEATPRLDGLVLDINFVSYDARRSNTLNTWAKEAGINALIPILTLEFTFDY